MGPIKHSSAWEETSRWGARQQARVEIGGTDVKVKLVTQNAFCHLVGDIFGKPDFMAKEKEVFAGAVEAIDDKAIRNITEQKSVWQVCHKLMALFANKPEQQQPKKQPKSEKHVHWAEGTPEESKVRQGKYAMKKARSLSPPLGNAEIQEQDELCAMLRPQLETSKAQLQMALKTVSEKKYPAIHDKFDEACERINSALSALEHLKELSPEHRVDLHKKTAKIQQMLEACDTLLEDVKNPKDLEAKLQGIKHERSAAILEQGLEKIIQKLDDACSQIPSLRKEIEKNMIQAGQMFKGLETPTDKILSRTQSVLDECEAFVDTLPGLYEQIQNTKVDRSTIAALSAQLQATEADLTGIIEAFQSVSKRIPDKLRSVALSYKDQLGDLKEAITELLSNPPSTVGGVQQAEQKIAECREKIANFIAAFRIHQK